MKKLLGTMLILVVIITACGAPKEENNKKESSTKAQEISTTQKEENEVENNFSKDVVWSVADELELKIDSVKMTEDKKSFVVKYTYKNNGAKSEDGKEKEIIIEPSFVVDKGENTLDKDTLFKSENAPKSLKKGETCEGAELAYKMIDKSDMLKVQFSYLSSDGAQQSVTFEIPVE